MAAKAKEETGMPQLPVNGDGLCTFWHVTKGKVCGKPSQVSSKFCLVHCPPSAEKLRSGELVVCPYDAMHVVPAKRMRRHEHICPTRIKLQAREAAPYFQENCNFGATENGGHSSSFHRDEDAAARTLIDRVCAAFTTIADIPTTTLNPPRCQPVWDKASEDALGAGALRHIKQQVSIIGHMERFGLLDGFEKPVFVELGAGRGGLASTLAQVLPKQDKNFLLVDRKKKAMRRNADAGFLQSGSVSYFERLQIDLKDCNLSGVEGLSGRNVVGMSKHLCGVATDLGLRCIVDTLPAQEISLKTDTATAEISPDYAMGAGAAGVAKPGNAVGLSIATCCHQVCDWQSYVGQAFFHAHGLTSRDFEFMTRLSSWCVCASRSGNNTEQTSSSPPRVVGAAVSPASVSGEQSATEDVQIHTSVDASSVVDDKCTTWVSVMAAVPVDERAEIGRKCKRLIDAGRIDWLVRKGWQAELFHFTDPDITPENCLILARRNSSPSAT